MSEITKEQREQFIKNQEKYCKEKDAPFFMPSNGRCYKCNRDIIPKLIEKGEDGSSLVTGCPLCYHSYCD